MAGEELHRSRLCQRDPQGQDADGVGEVVSAREWCKRSDVPLTPWQEWACDFLEARGLRFMVDFGYQNAEDKAETICALWWSDPS